MLTPYLGQLRLLQEYLSEDNDPWLNELDSFELLQAGLLTQAAAKVNKRPLRLSTIGIIPQTLKPEKAKLVQTITKEKRATSLLYLSLVPTAEVTLGSWLRLRD